MTGAGKTYTMLGDIYNSATGEAGICAMAIEGIFGSLTEESEQQQYVVKMSYLEIYNERVIDLLGHSSSSLGLMIVEDPIRGVTVPDLAEFEVTSSKELLQLVLKGNLRRTMAETSTNQFSSRSHAIMQIALESRCKTVAGFELTMAKLSLVDLAGSERAVIADTRGLRMLEGGKINRSLLALGNCINILSDKTKAGISFVPYRDSKLTRLLKDSLGGNTKTAMIACITSGVTGYDENLNTLKYAERAKKIKKTLSRNTREVELHAAQYKEIIESLKSEIVTLKEKMLAPSCEPVIITPIETVRPSSFAGTSSRPSPAATVGLRELEQEIVKTKVLKDKYQEELTRESEEAVQSLKASQNSLQEDDSHLYKLSQELLSKYEEHYEMRQSVQELSDMNAKNAARLAELQASLDECVKAKIVEDIPKEQAEKIEAKIGEKAKEIEALQATIDSNENIRKQLQASLLENAAIQQKYLALVAKVQSHKKKDVLELQIAVRSLRLEKMDLMMQNLEMKRATKLAEIENEGKDQKITEMMRELERVKSELQIKEAQLLDSQSKISTQRLELKKLKGLRKNHTPIRRQPSDFKDCLRVPKRLASNGAPVVKPWDKTEPEKPTDKSQSSGRFLTLSFTRPGENRELRKERLLLEDDDVAPDSDLSPEQRERMNDAWRQDEEGKGMDDSFISLSSVTVNCEDGSKTDIDLADTYGMIQKLGSGKPSTASIGKMSGSASKQQLKIADNYYEAGTKELKKTPSSVSSKQGFSQRSGSLNDHSQRKGIPKSALKEEPGKPTQRKKGAGYFSKVNANYARSTNHVAPRILKPDSRFSKSGTKGTRNVMPQLLLLDRPKYVFSLFTPATVGLAL